MNKKKRKKISALILLLAITIGYALLSTTLKINGIANIKSNTWDIHFENVVANTESTVTAELPSITDNATKVSYEVELSLPGDFYEFTVDAVNDGSINGIIEKIDHKVYESDGITEATLPEYIKYSIVYDGTITAPQEGDILEAGESKTYRVRIEFDSEATTLPSADLTYVIVDEVKYTQTKSSGRELGKCEAKMNQILDNPNSFRNQDQSAENLDIGLDDDCNVINLDMWVDMENSEIKAYHYELNDETDEYEMIIGDDGEVLTPATSAANIVNGEVVTPIPAYIWLSDQEEFHPVVKTMYTFSNYLGMCQGENSIITKMPKLPSTIKTIGENTFWYNSLTTVTIPKNVEKIESGFPSGTITSLSFEEGTKIKEIGFGAFSGNNLTGNLVLPQSVEKIGEIAFSENNLTSVTFPSSTRYVMNCVDSYGESCDSFDNGVTINHQY